MNKSIFKLASLAALLVLPLMAQAQDTASAIRGRVLDAEGGPIGGASVLVEDLRSGNTRNYETNDSGTFLAGNLPVGGPYRVTINGTRTIDIASIALGDTYTVTVEMSDAIEEVVAVDETPLESQVRPGDPSGQLVLELVLAALGNRLGGHLEFEAGHLGERADLLAVDLDDEP